MTTVKVCMLFHPGTEKLDFMSRFEGVKCDFISARRNVLCFLNIHHMILDVGFAGRYLPYIFKKYHRKILKSFFFFNFKEKFVVHLGQFEENL